VNPLYTVLLIAVVVVFAAGLRRMARWWDRRRAAALAKSLTGDTFDVTPLLSRIVELRAGHRDREHFRKSVDHKRRLRLIAFARRTVRRLGFFQATKVKQIDGANQ
jgi:hypothetical protein